MKEMMNAKKVVELWDKYGMYDCIREHSIRVCALALVISRILNSKKVKCDVLNPRIKPKNKTIDLDLVKYGALFHDIAKVEEIETKNVVKIPHTILGDKILKKEGLDEYSHIVLEHYLEYIVEEKYTSVESFIVNFADKFVEVDGYVTLKERFARFHKEYPQYSETFNKAYIILDKFYYFVFESNENYIKITKDLKEKLDFEHLVGKRKNNLESNFEVLKSVKYIPIIDSL